MSDRNRQKFELRSLILAMLDGTISDVEFEKLSGLINEDAEFLRYYVDYMSLCAALKRYGSAGGRPQFEAEGPESDAELWRQLLVMERTALAVEAEKSVQKAQPVQDYRCSSGSERPCRVSRWLAATAVLSAAAFIFLCVFVFLIPAGGPVVATVGDSYEANWVGSADLMKSGRDLQTGTYHLAGGFAEINLKSGTSVLVHGPAEVEIEDKNSVFLWKGSVSCKVPHEAIGFVVRTPRATVVDYGTEFGVAVDKEGQTQAHVFTGQVDLRTGVNPVVFKEFMRLRAGEAGAVDANDALARAKYRESLFVRDCDALVSARRLLGRNLVMNGDFESGPAGECLDGRDITNIEIEGWQDKGPATVFSYDAEGEPFPQQGRDPLPADCGRRFFVGRDNCIVSQEVDLQAMAYLIDGDGLTYSLSASLGGFENHGDAVTVKLFLLDADGQQIGTDQLDPVTPEERRNRTIFVMRSAKGAVAKGARKAIVELDVKQTYGVADAYADNIEFVLNGR